MTLPLILEIQISKLAVTASVEMFTLSNFASQSVMELIVGSYTGRRDRLGLPSQQDPSKEKRLRSEVSDLIK